MSKVLYCLILVCLYAAMFLVIVWDFSLRFFARLLLHHPRKGNNRNAIISSTSSSSRRRTRSALDLDGIRRNSALSLPLSFTSEDHPIDGNLDNTENGGEKDNPIFRDSVFSDLPLWYFHGILLVLLSIVRLTQLILQLDADNQLVDESMDFVACILFYLVLMRVFWILFRIMGQRVGSFKVKFRRWIFRHLEFSLLLMLLASVGLEIGLILARSSGDDNNNRVMVMMRCFTSMQIMMLWIIPSILVFIYGSKVSALIKRWYILANAGGSRSERILSRRTILCEARKVTIVSLGIFMATMLRSALVIYKLLLFNPQKPGGTITVVLTTLVERTCGELFVCFLITICTTPRHHDLLISSSSSNVQEDEEEEEDVEINPNPSYPPKAQTPKPQPLSLHRNSTLSSSSLSLALTPAAPLSPTLTHHHHHHGRSLPKSQYPFARTSSLYE